MCLFMSGVNGGSGVTPHGCCGHDMWRDKVLVDLCLRDGLWLLCNRPQQELSPRQAEESRDRHLVVDCSWWFSFRFRLRDVGHLRRVCHTVISAQFYSVWVALYMFRSRLVLTRLTAARLSWCVNRMSHQRVTGSREFGDEISSSPRACVGGVWSETTRSVSRGLVQMRMHLEAVTG